MGRATTITLHLRPEDICAVVLCEPCGAAMGEPCKIRSPVCLWRANEMEILLSRHVLVISLAKRAARIARQMRGPK